MNRQEQFYPAAVKPQARARVPTFKSVSAFAVLAVLIVAPAFMSDYQTFQLTMTMTYAIAVLGLNLLTGYNGQISIGHGAFMAIGGYLAAVTITHFGVSYWLTLPAAGLIGFVFGYFFGFPALRLEGFYLAVATFSLALVTPQILKHKSIEHWTGGVQGIVLEKPAAPFGLPFSPDQWLYFLFLAIAICLFFGVHNLLRGRIGRALEAIRDNPIAAEAMGINTARYKTITFGISAAYASVAGAMGAILVQFVSPDSYPLLLSVMLKIGLVVGGMGAFLGPIFGAAFIQFMPNITADLSTGAPSAIYGAILIAVICLMPRGLVGLMTLISERIRAMTGRR